jgi:hypothetical protein
MWRIRQLTVRVAKKTEKRSSCIVGSRVQFRVGCRKRDRPKQCDRSGRRQNRFPRKLVVCRECQIPIEPVRHRLIPREGRGADIRNLDVLLLSDQQNDQSRHGHETYRLWGHGILRLRERSRRLQRDDARGHFRQIRRSDYEAARSICCRTWIVSARKSALAV